MHQFLNAPESAFQNLEARATHSCVRFRQQQLPPCCNPDRADIGFEIDAATGQAFLHIQKGIAYSGRSTEIVEWIETGTKAFSSFQDLADWIRGPLFEIFDGKGTPASAEGRRTNDPQVTGSGEIPHPASLTDLSQVREQIRKDQAPVYIDQADLARRLLARVRGQDAAIEALSAAVARHSARRQPRRPAVLFAVGPTGVGKTRSAEVLAEVLSNLAQDTKPYQYLRLDMSEYQEAHRVSQLIGSPQGYVGHGEGSQFANALVANPRCVVLFDEIEKAHSAILRVLMNAMDAGRLSSASRTEGGHEIDCRQAIFMFTSNLDARAILRELESRDGFGKRTLEDEVCRRRLQSSGIAPEIVGRIGRFLVYRPLSAETRAEILAGVIAEVAAEYGITVTYVEPAVIVELMKAAGGGTFGMRPGQFLIDELLGSAFSEAARTGRLRCRVAGPPFRCIPGGVNADPRQEKRSSGKRSLPPDRSLN